MEPDQIGLESRIRYEIRKKGEIDPIYKLELLKKEIERQLTAEKLLKNVLGEEDYKNFLIDKKVKVKSKRYPNRVYIVRELGMIEVKENNKLIEKLCINPKESNFPLQDQLVSKKLGLEDTEVEGLILRVANHVPISNFELFVKRVIKLDLNIFDNDKNDNFWERIAEDDELDLGNVFKD